MKTWFDGQRTKCRCGLGRPRGRDAYVHNVQAWEHGDEEEPGRSANLDCPGVAVQDSGLQTDPVPVKLYELWEALHGDVNGLLNGSFKFDQQWRQGVSRKDGRLPRNPFLWRRRSFASRSGT